MASVNGVTIRFDQIKGFKRNSKGLQEVRCFPGTQACLIDIAQSKAAQLDALWDGYYDWGPDDFGSGAIEPVTGTRHNPPRGAHSFVRAFDPISSAEQRKYNVLNSIL